MFFLFFFWRILCLPPIFVVGPALTSYCCPPLFPWPRATKHKPSQFSHIHLPTIKVKMKLVYNLSGTSHARNAQRIEQRETKRRSFTSAEKMKLVRAVESAINTENLHLSVAATRFGVSPSCVVNWRKNAVALSDSSVENNCTLHKGPTSILSDLKEELFEFIEHWRAKGFPITRMGLARKVGKIKPEFLHKSYGARMMAISRFLAANNLTHHVATHKAQRVPRKFECKALEFLEYICP